MSLWRRYLDWRLRNVFKVTSDAEGFDVVNRGHAAHTSWSAIDRIVAYKRDIFTVDMICLLVFSSNKAVELNEEMEGFDLFSKHMADALNPEDDWWLRVAFPAFETCETLVFARQDLR